MEKQHIHKADPEAFSDFSMEQLRGIYRDTTEADIISDMELIQ